MPLNLMLYTQLQRAFGRVEIGNEGEEAIGETIHDPLTGKLRNTHTTNGEYYKVACPRCNDTRQRLWINYRWGTLDSFGRPQTFLAHCFNEDCLRDPYHRQRLIEMIEFQGQPLSNAVLQPGAQPVEVKAVLPGITTPLDQLPPHHPANTYLAGRGFDCRYLARTYGLCYCEGATGWVNHRIIIPMFDNGQLKGWQARYVGEIDFKADGAPPKYWTMPLMRRNLYLYGYDFAKNWSTIIIVEGPADCWRLGGPAVAPWGSGLSGRHVELLQMTRAEAFVYCPDGEVWSKPMKARSAAETTELLRQRLGGRPVVEVRLPEGIDPGDSNPVIFDRVIREQAAVQGMQLRIELLPPAPAAPTDRYRPMSVC